MIYNVLASVHLKWVHLIQLHFKANMDIYKAAREMHSSDEKRNNR